MRRDRTTAYLSGVALAALIMPAGAGAQQVLDPIVVQGASEAPSGPNAGGAAAGSTSREAATGPVNGYVADSTTAGSKSATPITQIPQSVSVIGREEIDDRGASKVDEALRYTAGVLAQPFGADGDTSWVYIRGFDATQTGMYLDGLQSFAYGFGGMYLDAFALERVEVLRGASSVLYGGSNPGGLVNSVSKHPDGERMRYLETGINDAGNAWVGFDIGDKAGPAIDYRVTGRIAGGEGYTDFEDDFRGFIAPSVALHIDKDTDFTLLTNYTHLEETHGGGGFLPYYGTVANASFGKIDREANFTEPSIDTYEREQFSVGWEFEHRFAPDWAFRQNFRYAWAEVHEVALYAYGYANSCADPDTGASFTCIGAKPDASNPGNDLYRINFEHTSEVNSVLIDNQIEGRLQTGAIQHRLLFGLDYKWYQLDQVQLSGAATPISATDPVYGSPVGARGAYLDEVDTLSQLGVYVQDQLRFGEGWIVTLGGRYDVVETEVDSRLGDASDYQSDETAFSGRAGVAYEFKNGLTPYASVSTFFNPQIGTTSLGEPLVPESGQQYEVGVKYAPKWFDGIVTAAWFDLTKQNVLVGNIISGNQEQIGEVNSRGIELEVKANLTKDLKLTAFLTVFDLEITEDGNPAIVGNTPYLIPETQAGVALDYTFRDGALSGITLGGGVRYNGESWADNENTLKVPDVVLFDAKIGYAQDNWGVDLNVSNILDEEYVSGCQTAYSCSWGEGRVIKLKAHTTW